MCDDFKKKWDKWIECFCGEDIHSLTHQAANLTRNSMVMQFVIRLIRLAPVDSEGNKQLNEMIWNAFLHMSAHEQALAIRRMIDGHPLGYTGNTPRKDESVYSLRALLEDMKKNAPNITRENFVRVATNHKIGQEKRDMANDMHGIFDRLSGTDVVSRNSSDKMNKRVFEALIRKLNKCDTVKNHVDKFIAHSATPESRGDLNDEEIRLEYATIYEAEKEICQIIGFLGFMLEDATIRILPILRYDRLDFIEKPLIHKSNSKEMNSIWKQLEDEIIKWADWDWYVLIEDHNN